MLDHYHRENINSSATAATVRIIRQRVIGKPRISIRLATPNDIEALLLVEEEAWKDPSQRADADTIRARVLSFPPGVIVAESKGDVWGFVVVSPIEESFFADTSKNFTWSEIAQVGIETEPQDFSKKILYGVNLSVSSCAPTGTQFQLMQEVGKLAIRLNVKEILLGGRIPSYHKFSEKMTAEEYIHWKVKNRPRDPELRMYSHAGLEIVRSLPGYFPDQESCDYGVLLRWKNPFFGKHPIFRSIASFFFKL